MFLAIRELNHAKSKFILIIIVIALISYLVYFLTALANGLATSYTNAVVKWNADSVILTTDSNDNMMMSYMNDNDFETIKTSDIKSKIGLFPAVINNPEANNILESRVNVYFVGIENDSFLKPSTLDLKDNQVIADNSLKKEGYKIGDTFGVTGSDKKYEIIGFSSKTTYQTAPVIYMNLNTWQKYRYDSDSAPNLFSGVIVRGDILEKGSNLTSYSINQYIQTLPGYTAQVLTFSVMIVFLIIIASFVLGIFIYVLTIQKTSMFGVMKAQGISNLYIGGSVIIQTFLLVAIGLIIGLILTIISGIFLSNTIPFNVNIMFYIIITFAFFLFSFLGGLFSVRAVLKIDPLRAIGG